MIAESCDLLCQSPLSSILHVMCEFQKLAYRSSTSAWQCCLCWPLPATQSLIADPCDLLCQSFLPKILRFLCEVQNLAYRGSRSVWQCRWCWPLPATQALIANPCACDRLYQSLSRNILHSIACMNFSSWPTGYQRLCGSAGGVGHCRLHNF